MLIDISRTIGWDDIVYPGDPPTSLTRLCSIADGAAYDLSALNITVHAGTHLDAPSHFVDGGATIASLPLERFYLKATVVNVGHSRVIEPADLGKLELEPGSALLLKTSNALLPRDAFTSGHAVISEDCARFLVTSEIGLLGIDYVSIEEDEAGAFPLHQILLSAGVLLLEDIDLRSVEPGEYTLMCFPLLIAGAEASPCRAVLMTPD